LQSRLSTIKFDERRTCSFSGFLKSESTENIICKALEIKNSSIELKSTSQILNESFIRYSSQEENELSININNNRLKVIKINEIENANITNENNSEKNDESIKIDKHISTNSGFNCSLSNHENEFYLEIENYNNNFASETKINSKTICSFNSSFEKNSDNNSNFNLNEKAEEKFIIESPLRPRKNTVSHKNNIRLKSIFQNSSKKKIGNDNIQIIINDNKSENQIDSNLKLKNFDNINENEIIGEAVKLKTFKSSDDLNKIHISSPVNHLNDSVLKTTIDFEDYKEMDNKEIICFDSFPPKNINISKDDRINIRCDNKNSFNFDNLIEGKGYMNRNSINLLNSNKEKINNLKKNDSKNENSHSKKKVSLSLEEQKETAENYSSNNSNYHNNGNLEEIIFETENALINSNSKSFYKLRTINEELESNYGSVNHPDNKNAKIENNYNIENTENPIRKYSARKDHVKFLEQNQFKNENIKINSDHLISCKEEVNRFLLKKSKSFNNKVGNQSKKIVTFNEDDENYEIISSIGDISKTQNFIKMNSGKNNVPKFSL
jgi:hypothetical protein